MLPHFEPDAEKVRTLRTRLFGSRDNLIRFVDEHGPKDERGRKRFAVAARSLARVEKGKGVVNETIEPIAWAFMKKGAIRNLEDLRRVDWPSPPPMPPGLALQQCLQDCLQWERSSSEPLVEARSIALDLNNGADHLLEFIARVAAVRIDARMVCITDDPKAITTSTPPEVLRWVNSVRHSIGLIQSRFDSYKARGTKTVRLQVKMYAEVPVIHGIAVAKGGRRRRYVTECYREPGPPELYLWGDGQYAIIDDDAEPELRERGRKFDEKFEQLWNGGPEFVINDSHGKWPGE